MQVYLAHRIAALRESRADRVHLRVYLLEATYDSIDVLGTRDFAELQRRIKTLKLTCITSKYAIPKEQAREIYVLCREFLASLFLKFAPGFVDTLPEFELPLVAQGQWNCCRMTLLIPVVILCAPRTVCREARCPWNRQNLGQPHTFREAIHMYGPCAPITDDRELSGVVTLRH